MPRVLMWVPLPPPFAGPEVASAMLVEEVQRLLPDLRVESATLRASNMAKGRLDASGMLAFARALRRFVAAARQVDTVYLVASANDIGALRDAVLIATARALGRRIVLHFRGGRYAEYLAGTRPVLRAIVWDAWGAATLAIAQTPRLAEALAGAVSGTRVEVVPNGLPPERYPAKTDYARPRRLLFVGHLAVSKGFLDLAHAFRVLRVQHPDLVLVCAGELPTPSRAVAAFLPADQQADYLRRRHALCDEILAFLREPGVEYAGVVSGDAKTELFRSSDVFVLPSYTEGFSVAILEAMFHGLPVVTSSVGGSPDIIRDGGVLVPPGAPEVLATAIADLIADPARCEQLGRHNASEARQCYALPVVARHLASLLADV